MSDEIPVTSNTDDIHPVAKPFLFLGQAMVKRNFIWLPLAGMILCSIIAYWHPQKHPLPIEEGIPFSWALFGFVAYSLIVFAAPVLFKLLARSEDYYGEGGLPDPEVSTDPMVTGEPHHD